MECLQYHGLLSLPFPSPIRDSASNVSHFGFPQGYSCDAVQTTMYVRAEQSDRKANRTEGEKF
jgi:hypothetical protein